MPFDPSMMGMAAGLGGDPNDPSQGQGPGPSAFSLRGSPQPVTARPWTPPPASIHPALLHRLLSGAGRAVAGAGRNFMSPITGIDPTYADILSPEQQSYVKRQALMQLGTGLLRAGGPAPQGTQNFGSRLGSALAGVDTSDLQKNMADRAMTMWQMELYRNQYAQVQDAFDSEPALGPDADLPTQGARAARIYQRLIQIGGPGLEAAKGLEPFITLTHPELNPANYETRTFIDPRPNSPTYGQQVDGPVSKITGQPSPMWMHSGAGLTPATAQQQHFTNQGDFLKSYNAEIGDYRDRLEQLRGATALFNQSKSKLMRGDGPTQYAFMRQFINGLRMKGARPGEADANMLDEASSTIAALQRKLQGYLGENKLLTPAEVNEIGDVLKRIEANVTGSWNNTNRQYRTWAQGNRATVGNAESFLQDPRDVRPARLDGTPSVQPDSAPVGPTLQRLRNRQKKPQGQ